jgi:hypothetical protein
MRQACSNIDTAACDSSSTRFRTHPEKASIG